MTNICAWPRNSTTTSSRVQRDQQDTIRFANEKLFKDLLPTLDNLERALQSGREQGRIEGLLEGVDLTYKHFLDTLQKMGIKQVSSVGEVFDPAKHQGRGASRIKRPSPNTSSSMNIRKGTLSTTGYCGQPW